MAGIANLYQNFQSVISFKGQKMKVDNKWLRKSHTKCNLKEDISHVNLSSKPYSRRLVSISFSLFVSMMWMFKRTSYNVPLLIL